jgi:hypothetical protein
MMFDFFNLILNPQNNAEIRYQDNNFLKIIKIILKKNII